MAFVKSIKKDENLETFNLTSSLNKYFICNHCSKKIQKKSLLKKHLESCLNNRTCQWCKLVFKNRGNLVTHAFYIHGDNSIKNAGKSEKMVCEVCNKTFSEYFRLKYHIRSVHFNLQANVLLRDGKKINQIWFEEVLNTDNIVEIKKTGNNVLLLRRYNSEKSVNLLKNKHFIDLREIYPTYTSREQMQCEICHKWMLKRDFKLHYEEKHTQVKKHQCRECNATFKRSYFFIRHDCHKKRENNGENMNNQNKPEQDNELNEKKDEVNPNNSLFKEDERKRRKAEWARNYRAKKKRESTKINNKTKKDQEDRKRELSKIRSRNYRLHQIARRFT